MREREFLKEEEENMWENELLWMHIILIIFQIACGMQALEEQGIVHRDLAARFDFIKKKALKTEAYFAHISL